MRGGTFLQRSLVAAGVPPQHFADAVGMSLTDLMKVANYKRKRVDADPGVIWQALMMLLNRRLGDILQIRIELERREMRHRKARVAARMKATR